MSSPPRSWRQEIRATLALAVPVITGQIGMMMMGVVDVAMVGHVSADALAATALGNLYSFGVLVFCMGVLHGLDPVISQAIGAKDPGQIGTNVQRGFVLAVLLTLPATALMLPAQAVFTALQQPADVVPTATGYAHASIPGIFPFLAFILLRQTLQAFSQPRAIVFAVLVANVVNAGLDWVLIYGQLGVPVLGAVGCAWATSACRILLVVLLLAFGWRHLGPLLRPLQRDALAAAPLLRLLRLGAPVGSAHLFEYGAFMTTALFAGQMGKTQLAGHHVAINLASLSFMVPLGLSSAAAVRTGYAVGRDDPPGLRRAAVTSLLLGAGTMAGFAILFLALPAVLSGLYSNDQSVVALAASLLPIAGVFQVFDGVQVVAAGILRGAGHTRTPMLVHLVGFWVLGIPIGAALGFRAGMGPQGLWWGLVIGLGTAAVVLLLCVRHLLGQRVRRLHLG